MLWRKFASNSLPFGLLPRLVIWVKTWARKQFYTLDPLGCCSGGEIWSWEHWVVGHRKLFPEVTAQGLLLGLGLTPHCNTQGQSLGLWVFTCVLLCLYGSLSRFTLRNISSKLKCEPVLKSYLPPLIILQFFQSIDFRALWTSFFSCCLSWQTLLLSLLPSLFLLGSLPKSVPPYHDLAQIWLPLRKPCFFAMVPLSHPDHLCTIFHHRTFCICLLFYLSDFSP